MSSPPSSSRQSSSLSSSPMRQVPNGPTTVTPAHIWDAVRMEKQAPHVEIAQVSQTSSSSFPHLSQRKEQWVGSEARSAAPWGIFTSCCLLVQQPQTNKWPPSQYPRSTDYREAAAGGQKVKPSHTHAEAHSILPYTHTHPCASIIVRTLVFMMHPPVSHGNPPP